MTARTPFPSGSGTGIGSIERHVELAVDREELWRLISTAAGWRQWMVDDATLAGDAGVVRDGDVVREVRLESRADRTSVELVWWERDDPASVSRVRLEILDGEGADGASRLLITETSLVDVARANTDTGTATAEARLAWEVRVCSLWACTVAAALV